MMRQKQLSGRSVASLAGFGPTTHCVDTHWLAPGYLHSFGLLLFTRHRVLGWLAKRLYLLFYLIVHHIARDMHQGVKQTVI